jgi:hypothetical protein
VDIAQRRMGGKRRSNQMCAAKNVVVFQPSLRKIPVIIDSYPFVITITPLEEG